MEVEKKINKEIIYVSLCKKYLTVFTLAAFADWLQGPYLYRLYISYGYNSYDISLLYAAGFASSTIFGIGIGHLADKYGQKMFCVSYHILYSLACLAKIFNNFWVLIIGRVLGGISSLVLFSTFESWYVSQHLSNFKLDKEWIGITLSKSAFYNGLSAIVAGCVSAILADKLNFGPLAPFILAVPILAISGGLCAIFWEENNVIRSAKPQCIWINSLQLIFNKNNRIFLYLGIIQSLFESVMNVFIFLWTPVLDPINPSHGIVFGSFMFCIMLGSSFYSLLLSKYRVSCDILLQVSLIFSLCSILTCTYGAYIQTQLFQEHFGTYICLAAFMCYEIAVGMYYPAIGYLRGIIVPEAFRTCMTNWFRMPTNILTCLVLIYIREKVPCNYFVFSISFSALTIATILCSKFSKLYNREYRCYHYSKFCPGSSEMLLL